MATTKQINANRKNALLSKVMTKSISIINEWGL